MEQDQNGRTESYAQAADELGKRLIALYNVRVFPRIGKVFADTLFQTGVEAGSYITSLADIVDIDAKVEAANKAVLKLNQTVYVLNVMKRAGYYTEAQAAPTAEYINGLLKAVKSLLQQANARQARPAAPKPEPIVRRVVRQHVRQVPVYTHQQAPQPVQQAVQQTVTVSAPAAAEQVIVDPDGFDDPV